MHFENEVEAETLLLDELWEIIFTKISASDLWSSSQTCQLFHRLLLPTKNAWMFEMVFPHICDYLDKQAVLKCRSVCKRWNTVVDNYSSDLNRVNNQAMSPNNFVYSIKGRIQSSRGNPKCDNLRKFKFTEKMSTHPRSPFISRSIQIIDDGEYFNASHGHDGGYQEVLYRQHLLEKLGFLKDTFDFVETFGKYIWYLHFSPGNAFSNSSFLRLPLVEFLRKELSFMENLRMLKVTCKLIKYREPPALVAHELPDLPNLESLLIEQSISLDNWLEILLLQKYNVQLKLVGCKSTAWNTVNSFLKWEWSNLTELHLSDFRSEEELRSLSQLKAPQLIKLGLCGFYHLGSNNFKIFLETLRQVANNCQNLKSIKLKATDFTPSQVANAPCNLVAPTQLKTLHVEIAYFTFIPSFSFLLRFPFVECVNFPQYTCNKQDEKRGLEEEKVQVHKFRRCLYKSNIWEVLPSLKECTYGKALYTREGYKKFKAGTELNYGK